MAIGLSSVGENVPLDTMPTGCPPAATGKFSRGTRRPANSSPIRFSWLGSSFRRPQGVRPDEGSALQVDGKPQARLVRVDRLRKFVAVQRHAGF